MTVIIRETALLQVENDVADPLVQRIGRRPRVRPVQDVEMVVALLISQEVPAAFPRLAVEVPHRMPGG